MENKKQGLKEDIFDMLCLVKACLTSFWFWLPILFTIFLYSQFLIFFFIHPLLLLVVPVLISIYALHQENKRLKTRYKIEDGKVLLASDPLGTKPHFPNSKFNLEQKVEDYMNLLKMKKKEKKK